MEVPAVMGIIIDVIVALILIFSFLGGLKEGAVKELLGLLAFVISLPLAGLCVRFVSGWLSIIPDVTWRNLLAFLLAMGLIIIILHIIFLFPQNLLNRVWKGGFSWNLLGGVFGLGNSVVGLVLMVSLLNIYPVLPWLSTILDTSKILGWLVALFGGVLTGLIKIVSGT